jgi:curved DNA-binding protein CbpA
MVEVSRPRTHYEILGVDPGATAEQIKSAWRKAARQHHPDRNPNDDQAAACFKLASAAYECLSDPKKRRSYDVELAYDELNGCVLCGSPVVEDREVCMWCGIRIYQHAQAQRAAAQRAARAERAAARHATKARQEPPPPRRPRPRTTQDVLEEEYAWMGDPDNFDRMMGRRPEDYEAFTGASADELLGALLSEAAIRTAHASPRNRRGGVRVVIELDNMNVSVDRNTIHNLRRVHRSLGAAQQILRRVRTWFD